MTITDDERREVAARLRANAKAHPHMGLLLNFAFADKGLNPDGEMEYNVTSYHAALRLADLIEPEERTCHMIHDHLTDTVFCDVCGERFDGVAQYMAMGPNGFSPADYKGKYKDAKFCPNCGAKVVDE